ncbi:hypothetical protein D2T31_08345 [Sinirhodobacter populi]|uniref:DUF3800 domain-containing protein n=1 Tax=Paenirhodobacter populi TaxID=2306993 RepID=A0A443KAY6_9RHOB|nr:DUF3800 domain-containing protein [Sinirhodobacter populi]RWR29905.1 hypothetical protein D2T31_08345 [Sinirhodobacter populi]
MAYLYLDDSKHHPAGFSLAAFVICETDPSGHVEAIFRGLGFDPRNFEYKSSAKMAGDDRLQKLRSAMMHYVGTNCRIAVCVVEGDRRLGPAALRLLHSALSHPNLEGQDHEVFFDEGLFQSPKSAADLASIEGKFTQCRMHFEQDSRKLLGIQLADLVAHTCSTMLLETLGHVTKKVVLEAPGDSAYDGQEVELGFEMWACIRYAFLSMAKQHSKDELGEATVKVFPWGLFIDESTSERVAAAAMRRFGENYLGCIH